MKKVVITTGDPAGCGPFISVEAVNVLRKEKVDFFVVGDSKVLEKIPGYARIKRRINLIDVNTWGIDKLRKARISKLGGQASLNYLDRGVRLLKKKRIKRLVTAPLSKEAVKLLLPQFCGHTEYLADYFKVKNYAMMMASEKIKVVPFSRHIPLREVSSVIKKKDFIKVVSLVYASLRDKFKIKKPKIAVASVNPHAGVNTFLDKEEKEIAAGLQMFKAKTYGPYPGDTIFTQENLKKFDCVICAYHDQAMVPFKLISFKEGVNLTLGLPIIRTSPVHGVAYDLIKEGKRAFATSMVAAVKLAIEISI
ncbi:MAG: 4-hydroxythreonine-4-phosphate dehydrogenase PdxA [Candidatus Omnitrophota bacterium]|nr:MAG: 4-hydroxythreonine-4-phosphate dehydrogenase PdxA [Candidatus Omnitrophota bacterium]